MVKKKMRAGLVGSGFAAAFHFESLKKVHGVEVEVSGVYSAQKQKRGSFAQARGIRAFDTLDELLDRSDVVHVLTPPSAHEALAVATLGRDKFAIVEKPLTGYFGDGSPQFDGDRFPRQVALDHALQSVDRIGSRSPRHELLTRGIETGEPPSRIPSVHLCSRKERGPVLHVFFHGPRLGSTPPGGRCSPVCFSRAVQ